MNFTITKSTPIRPIIEVDGGYYALCGCCYKEIDPHNNICSYCKQFQDWSWLIDDGK